MLYYRTIMWWQTLEREHQRRWVAAEHRTAAIFELVWAFDDNLAAIKMSWYLKRFKGYRVDKQTDTNPQPDTTENNTTFARYRSVRVCVANMWTSYLYFSPADGTNPKTNTETCNWKTWKTEVLKYWGVVLLSVATAKCQ